MKSRAILILLAAVVVNGRWLFGPASAAPPTSATQPASTRPVDPEIAADQLIRQLLLDKPSRLVLEPTATAPSEDISSAASREIVDPVPMPPGSIIAERLGRLVKDPSSGAWMMHFESEKNILREPPIHLLPNRLLEYMEEVSVGGMRAGVKFRISGEVTEYRGSKFLLLRKVLVEREMGAL